MNTPRTCRDFLTEVGRGMVVAAVGYEVASDLGLASALGEEAAESLSFGPLEPLVCLMQESPADRLLPALAGQLQSGTDLPGGNPAHSLKVSGGGFLSIGAGALTRPR